MPLKDHDTIKRPKAQNYRACVQTFNYRAGLLNFKRFGTISTQISTLAKKGNVLSPMCRVSLKSGVQLVFHREAARVKIHGCLEKGPGPKTQYLNEFDCVPRSLPPRIASLLEALLILVCLVRLHVCSCSQILSGFSHSKAMPPCKPSRFSSPLCSHPITCDRPRQ